MCPHLQTSANTCQSGPVATSLFLHMQTSNSTTSTLRRWSRHFICRRPAQVRYASRNTETYPLHISRPYVEPKSTFEATGIRAPIATALRMAFPNVKHPTNAQKDFIPAILSRSDVLLKDDTGTGKYVQILHQIRIISSGFTQFF